MTRFASDLRELIDTDDLDGAKAGGTKKAESRTETLTLTAEAGHSTEGYWIVISDAGLMSMVFTLDGKLDAIKEKNEAPSIDKTVYESAMLDDGPAEASVMAVSTNGNVDNKQVKVNDAALGDEVTYTVTIDVGPGAGYLAFVDTLTEGLTFKQIDSMIFYPQGAKDEFGERPARQVYPDSNGNEALTYEVSLFDKDETLPFSLEEPSASMISQAAMTGGITTDDGKQTLKITFTEDFLQSLRTLAIEGTTLEDQSPLVKGDPRLNGKNGEKSHPEYYNVFLGGMDTMEDDGGQIVITYRTVLNANAIKTDYQKNSAKLEYGHDADSVIKGDEDDTAPAEVKTYTYDLVIDKYAYGPISRRIWTAPRLCRCQSSGKAAVHQRPLLLRPKSGDADQRSGNCAPYCLF